MAGDYVDYTLLKKRGILKLKEEKFKNSLSVKDGFVDLTGFKDNMISEPSGSTNSTSNFGFLSDMASIGSSSPSNISSNENVKVDESDLSALKIKIDDMEYKLERFIERIDKLEEKLDKQ
jgi:ACT domain-containing protein